MAEGSKLILTFETDEGKTTTMTFNRAKTTATTTDVKALVNAIITNKVIFENTPVTPKQAKIATTTENFYDLADLSRETPYTVPEAFERGLVSVDEYLDTCSVNGVEPDMALMAKVRKATEEALRKATEGEIHTAELR